MTVRNPEIKVPPKVLARERLSTLALHIRMAADMARIRAGQGATTHLAIIAKKPDGSGQLSAEFELDEFLADLELLTKEPS